ncbi:hypothetical protein [Vitiosangium sp. GDMCC 1.1324]|uniref:hypothetical protein n=1 Tax=Vitiosangium sp. (strain GDMCC 1.1324) TaxID=2138576 RepID=UPI001E51EC67|nr:hypothetical protein [Vitiosangium sp. GDMCC 1.1324]
MWDIETTPTVSGIKIAKGVDFARLFPTGDRLVATFDDRTVLVYELASGAAIASASQAARTRALVVSPDPVRVYWAGFGSDTVVWSWSPGENPRPLLKDIHTFEPRGHLSLSRGGTELWCFFEWDLVGFDTRTGAELLHSHGSRSQDLGDGVVLSSERCVVAVVSVLNRDDEPVRPRLYKRNLESGETLWRTEILNSWRYEPLLTVARNERWLATVGKEGVTFRSVLSGRVLGILPIEVPEEDISCLSLSPDDRLLAMGISNGDLIVHDLGDSIHESLVAVPHIAARSRDGSPLLLRLQSRAGLWLRVHENGDLEQAEGDARSDAVITPFAVSGPGNRLAYHPGRIHGDLLRRLRQYELTKPSPWSRSYPVQVFLEGKLVVEGYIGIERDTGMSTDIFGLGEHGGREETVDFDLNARQILNSIIELLALLPTD